MQEESQKDKQLIRGIQEMEHKSMKKEDCKNLRILIAEAKGIIAGMLRGDNVHELHAEAERALDALDSADWIVNQEKYRVEKKNDSAT